MNSGSRVINISGRSESTTVWFLAMFFSAVYDTKLVLCIKQVKEEDIVNLGSLNENTLFPKIAS